MKLARKPNQLSDRLRKYTGSSLHPHWLEAACFTVSAFSAVAFWTILRASVVIACPQSVQYTDVGIESRKDA
jgi:hypothetical protein